MIPQSYVHRKCKEGDSFTKLQEKIDHLLNMVDIQIFTKNEEELESLFQTIRTLNEDVGMQFGIEKCIIPIIKKGKNKNKLKEQNCAIREGKLKNKKNTREF